MQNFCSPGRAPGILPCLCFLPLGGMVEQGSMPPVAIVSQWLPQQLVLPGSNYKEKRDFLPGQHPFDLKRQARLQ